MKGVFSNHIFLIIESHYPLLRTLLYRSSIAGIMTNKKASFYILFSKALNKYYSGITTEHIEFRVHKHNISFHGHHFTAAANDWEVRLIIPCESYASARKTELYVKSMKSRKFIEKIIMDKVERDKLIDLIAQS